MSADTQAQSEQHNDDQQQTLGEQSKSAPEADSEISLAADATLAEPPDGLALAGKRKSSPTVSFKTCNFTEVDLEEARRETKQAGSARNKPHILNSVRYYVIILALISPFVVTFSKTIINFAITDMIDPRFIASHTKRSVEVSADQSNQTLYYFETDNSCPVDDETRARLISENTKDIERATTGTDKLEWDEVKQGLLKAAYSYGNAPLMVVGGRMSEMFGSHLIMSLSSLMIAICCILAPYLAPINFYLLFGDLVLLGVFGSFMTPAMMTLFANWLTPGEKALTLSFYFVASRLGYALSSMLCGLLFAADLSWRYVFFVAGGISLVFSATFFFGARSRPLDHPFISQLEINYLSSKNLLVRESLQSATNEGDKKQKVESYELKSVNESEKPKEENQKEAKVKTKTPWKSILTSVPVWAFIITKFCTKIASDTVQIELPTYLKRVMHFSANDNGFVNTSNYVVFCIGCVAIGTLSKVMIKKQPYGLSKTTIRKIFQGTASIGVGLLLIAMAYTVCDNTATQIILLLLFFLTACGTSGEGQIPMDITQRYTGTIHALASSISISGILEPTIVGYYMRGRAADRSSWKNVWLGASLISFLGGFVFIFFADAKVQPFDSLAVVEAANNDHDDEDEKKKHANSQTVKSNGHENKAFEKDQDLVVAEKDNKQQQVAEESHSEKKENDDDDEESEYKESQEI